MPRPANYRHKLFLLSALVIFTLPLISHAANFQNPLGPIRDVRVIITRIIFWIIGLSTFIAILALVVGGIRLTIGGFGNEQEAAAAKKIITWAIIGLTVVGLAAIILAAVRTILGI